MTRRTVRVTTDLFYQLDTQLPAERSSAGEPTVAEFASTDLLDIVDAFATWWDDLPATIPGRWDYRTVMTRARLAYAVAGGVPIGGSGGCRVRMRSRGPGVPGS